MLIHLTSPTKHVWCEIINTVHCSASTDKLEPLHVPSLRPPERKDAIFHKDIQTQWIYTLLVYYDEAGFRVVIADFLFELDNLTQFVVNESSLTFDQFVPLIGARIVKAGVDFRLLIFKAHVEGENVGILYSLRHVRMSCPMIKGKTFNESRVGGAAMLHLHNLYHEKVWFCRRAVNCKDSIDNGGRQFLCESCVQFC